MTVGSELPGLGAITRRVLDHRFGFLARGRQHNLEEAGCLAQVMPEPYAQEVS